PYYLADTPRGTADADGRFRIEMPPADRELQGDPLPVVAQAPGFGIAWAVPKQSADELTLRLVPDQPIQCRVMEREGRPAVGATTRGVSVHAAERLDDFLAAWKANWQAPFTQLNRGHVRPSGVLPAAASDRDGRFRVIGVGAERIAMVS